MFFIAVVYAWERVRHAQGWAYLWLGHPVGLGSDAKEKGMLYV